jgi:YjbE family integral membrane protein
VIDVASSLFLLAQVFFVDLILGADNAVVIALACGRLPPESARRALVLGAAGAIALRMVLILFANALLGVPLVKLVGAWTLIVIALNVRAQNGATPDAPSGRQEASAGDFMSAAAVIMLADAAMSLDNVVALAAIAGGSLWLLAAGVLLSIPILVYGAFVLTRILRLVPEIFTIGAVFLGWIAGGMAATDPLVAGWISANAPALGVFAPALAALFVIAAGRGAPRKATPVRTLLAARPAPPPTAASAPIRKVSVEPVSPPLPPLRAPAPTSVRPLPIAAGGDDGSPGFLEEGGAATAMGWTEDRLVVAGFILLAVLAGLIIVVASFFDSLT